MNLGLIDNVSGDVFQAFETMRLIAHQRLSRHDPSFVYLVQTISGDYAMDAGIAKEINNRYRFRDYLVESLADDFGFPGKGWTYHRYAHEFFRIPLMSDGKTYDAGRKQTIRFHHAIGDVAEMMLDDRSGILGLVTKPQHDDKPTLEQMKGALQSLQNYIYSKHIYWMDEDEDSLSISLVMPTIGCGLDKLNWPDVEEALGEAFKSDILRGHVRIKVVHKEEVPRIDW